MSKTTLIVVVVVILLLGIFGYVLLSDNNGADLDLNIDENALLNNGATSTDQDTPAVTSWQTYQNDQFDFTFSYPAQARTAVEAGRATVTFLGPDNTPNSEISDGFTFTVDTRETDGQTDLETFAQEQFEDLSATSTAIAEPRSITVGNNQAYEFEIESQLGPPVTYVVIEADDGQAFVVSYMVEDPANREYEDIIDTMISSLQYEPASEGAATTTE